MPKRSAGRGPLVEWLLSQGLLNGPFLFVDYWASVFGLEGGARPLHRERGWVDPALFRVTVDRPDLEVPRIRSYVLLFLVGPLLLPFRAFRRLGRYRIRYRSGAGAEARERLERHALSLDRMATGRVRVSAGERVLADGVLDPCSIAAFSSLFYATYKLPIATVTGILAMAIAAPLLHGAGLLDDAVSLWLPVVLPLVTLLLYIVYRDAVTAVVGVVPIAIGGLLLAALAGEGGASWGTFFGALALLLALMLGTDWLLIPRPVPPALLFYTEEEPGNPYERPEDRPYWLEGHSYWVWRYLMLVPAELNKIWERDWERVELWVRADGPDAGQLEWVVIDAHYRELWIPYDRLGPPERLARHRARVRKAHGLGEPGVWLVEVDADLIFHTPFLRTVSFIPEGEDVPALSLWHVLSGAFRRGPRDDPDEYLEDLDRLRMVLGTDVLADLPEVLIGFAARHLLALPWRYWRYPLGAQRRRETRLYGEDAGDTRPGAAAPELQIKARDASEGDSGDLS